MLVYAGIDEAGYGPMLGPLSVGATVFVLPDHDPADGAPNLWRTLDAAVCRSRKDKKKRIAVADSKKLKGANDAVRAHPLAALERGVFAFLGQAAPSPATCAELFETVAAGLTPQPWYDHPTDLPVAHTIGELRIQVARLRRAMERERVKLHAVRARLIDAADFNTLLDRMGNKAAVNFHAAIGHIDRIWTEFPGAHPRVLVDRHGGRAHYREPLHLAFPEAHITIVAETERVSRYTLVDPARGPLTVSFQTGAEDKHLPVALASMTAKYARELAMARLNRFFQGHVPELKPTAGYVQDARRYLDEINPVIETLPIDRARLIRNA